MRFSKVLLLLLVLTPQAAFSDAQLSEVQRALNKWQLDAGPVNGEWTAKTETALTAFLAHRGIEFDGEFGPDDYQEVVGQTGFRLPDAAGLEMCQSDGFPSVDSYKINDDDAGLFTISLRKGDYDRSDYRDVIAVYNTSKQNFSRQRAVVHSCEWLSPGKVYTVDFDVRISNVSAGTFFQIASEDPEGVIGLAAFPGSIRVDAGPTITMKAAYRGDYLNEWVKVRAVFMPDRGDLLAFRFYINGELGFEAKGGSTRFGFSSVGAQLIFGPVRGKSSMEAEVSFRDIVLTESDRGQPKP